MGFPGNLESGNLSRDILSREIGHNSPDPSGPRSQRAASSRRGCKGTRPPKHVHIYIYIYIHTYMMYIIYIYIYIMYIIL